MATASLVNTETSQSLLPFAESLESPDQDMRYSGDLKIISADYTIRAEWDAAYVVDVTLVVDCELSSPRHRFGLSGWKIDFELHEDTKIRKLWNAHVTRDGARCTVVHAKFCPPVSRGRAVLYFGFEACSSEPKTIASAPHALRVNGQTCEVNFSHARDLADCYYDYLFESRHSSRSPSPEPSRTPSRSPSPSPDRDSFLPPANDSLHQISPMMFNNKRVRNSSPSADLRDTKKAKTHDSEEAKRMHADDDEEKSTAQTPPRDFSPINDGCEVSDVPSRGRNRAGDSPWDADCVSQSDLMLGKRTSASDTVDSASSASTPPTQDFPRTLEIDYYRRSKALKQRKWLHMDYLDTCFATREEVILASVLDQDSTVLEPNMFPYDCPSGVTHWTLWSKKWLTEADISAFMNSWLHENMPSAVEWNHDDNMSDGLSINLFHVHVYIRCDA